MSRHQKAVLLCPLYRATKIVLGNKKPLARTLARGFSFGLSNLFETVIQSADTINDDADIATRFHRSYAYRCAASNDVACL